MKITWIRMGILLAMIVVLIWSETLFYLGIMGGFFGIIFLILAVVLSRKKFSKKDEKIEIESNWQTDWWNRALLVHVSEDVIKELKNFLKERYPEIDYRVSRLRNNLYIYYIEECEQDLLSQIKRDLEKMNFYVEEISYRKIMEEEQVSDEEWIRLLGREPRGPLEIDLRIPIRLYH